MNPFQHLGHNVPTKYCFQLPTNYSGETKFILAAHINWIREVISEQRIPTKFLSHERLTDDEVHAFLSQGICQPLGPRWIFLFVTALKVSKIASSFKPLDIPSNISQAERKTWPQIMDFIGESNFNFVWEQPCISLLHNSDTNPDELSAESIPSIQIEDSIYLSKLLKHLYINLEEPSEENSSSDTTRFPISNLSQALAIINIADTPSGNSKLENSIINNNNGGYSHFLIFHPYIRNTLQEAVTFSPQKLSSHTKQLFVIYQILQYLKDFQMLGLPTGDLTLSDFRTDECLYLSVIPNLTDILEKLRHKNSCSVTRPRVDPRVEKILKFVVRKVKGWEIEKIQLDSLQIDPQLIELLIRHWCEGLIPNYEYLMFLNYLSGRLCDGNPNFHPVFPWVTDFSQAQGGWRDLTKSKFRLNKGERQLDLMYEECGSGDNTIPHHITDVLSEITYYVYKARRIPKQVLCKFVRPKWVPAEYPVSIQRMQEWTPDECIPEFFDDPTIFQSIHDDLADLQVPKWSSSPQDFIIQHRKLLDSDYVSAKLHHWIDLTFGYKLSGAAAVKSKNIYLSLVDSHKNLTSHGMVQLFQTPHPPRNCSLRNMKNIVTYKELKKLRESDNDETPTDATDAKSNKSWKNININLPKHFDPMGLFCDFEVCLNFFNTHFPYQKSETSVVLKGLKNRSELPFSVKQFGCLLVELVLSQKLRHISIMDKVDQRFTFYKEIVKSSTATNPVPLFCKRAVQAIFTPETLEFSIPIDISLHLLLLGDRLGPIPFPSYFEELFKMMRTLRNYDRVSAVAAPDDIGLKIRVQELKVKSFSRDLIQIIHNLDEDGLELVMPFVIELFQNPETRVLAVWNLFCPFARAIGKKKAAEHLLSPIVQIYEGDYQSDKHLKLFHRSFLLQLLSCFGLQIFLENFSTLLIEAIGGWKSCNDQNEQIPRTHLTSTDLEIDSSEDSCGLNAAKKSYKFMTSRMTRAESEPGESGTQNSQPIEPEMFLMEPDVSDSEGTDSSNPAMTTAGMIPPALVIPSTGVDNNMPVTNSTSQSPVVANSYASNATGDSSEESTHQQILERTKSMSKKEKVELMRSSYSLKSASDISEMCCESVMWLSHRLGPVLTAKYLSRNLLRMLTLCYIGHLDKVDEIHNASGTICCEGDIHAKKVLECLVSVSDMNTSIQQCDLPNEISNTDALGFVDLYGDCFIERQYLPYCEDLISASSVRKITVTVEAALLGVSSLLETIFNYVPDTMVMALLKDRVMISVLTPLVNLICTETITFPSGNTPRSLLATKVAGMLNAIKKKIGTDMSQLTLKPLVLQLSETFTAVYSGSTKAEMAQVFGAHLAYQLYSNFCEIIVGSEHESLIRDLYLKHGMIDRSMSLKEDSSPSGEKTNLRKPVEQQSSFGSKSFGNRIQIQQNDTPHEEMEPSPPARKDTTRHLRGNWLAYWEHEVGRSESKFNFKQIKLQTFTGHTAAVRSIYSLNNENSFLTASKDKTVKLFSLRNQAEDSTSCQWTYPNHKKAVLSVIFHEALHLAASTDGFIHVWDPFVGKVVRVLEKGSAKTSPICCLRPILNTNSFVGAGIDGSLVVVDCRSCHPYELKIGIGQNSGLIRCMSVSESGQIVSVGHSSGMLSALDLRNGTLLGSWKGHEGEILQLIGHQGKYIISSSFDQSISVWNVESSENRLAFSMRGPTEPVHSLCTYESELISCTTSNRIGVHCGIDGNSDFSSTRLRSDTFKGIVTCMTLIPLNQFLLVGSDSGNVMLLC